MATGACSLIKPRESVWNPEGGVSASNPERNEGKMSWC